MDYVFDLVEIFLLILALLVLGGIIGRLERIETRQDDVQLSENRISANGDMWDEE